MFDIGFWELCIIAVIALLVLGPERLPTAARTLGLWVGKARRTVNSIKNEIDRELKLDELRKQVEEQKKNLQDNSILADMEKFSQDAKQTFTDVKQDLEQGKQDLEQGKQDLEQGKQDLEKLASQQESSNDHPEPNDSQQTLGSAETKSDTAANTQQSETSSIKQQVKHG